MEPDLEFLKIWHKTFSQNLAYVIEGLQAGESFNAEEIANSNICQVGQWLASQSIQIKELLPFTQLVAAHDQYHVVAGYMLALFQAGQVRQAKAMLSGALDAASTDVCQKIDSLAFVLVKNNLSAPRFRADEVARSHLFWNTSFEIGIDLIDQKHQAMAMLVEALSSLSMTEASTEQISSHIDALTKLIREDIEAESPLIEKYQHINAVHFADHIAAHHQILGYLVDIAEQIADGKQIQIRDVGTNFSEWFIGHLFEFDLELARHIV